MPITLTEKKLGEMRQQISGYSQKLAMTESHFSFPGRNRNEVLSFVGRRRSQCKDIKRALRETVISWALPLLLISAVLDG